MPLHNVFKPFQVLLRHGLRSVLLAPKQRKMLRLHNHPALSLGSGACVFEDVDEFTDVF